MTAVNFCNRKIEAILQRKSLNELDDVSTVPMVRAPRARNKMYEPIQHEKFYVPTKARKSTCLTVFET